MTSQEYILNKIRDSRRESFPMPSLDELSPVQYEDSLTQFMETVRLVGGEVVLWESGQYKGTPFRTFSNGAFIGGYSDHYPTYIVITK